MNKRIYRKFSPEFKREAVRLAEQSDGPITQVARELGVRANQIYKWRRQIQDKQENAFPGSGRHPAGETEIFDVQNKRFTTVTCERCTYTEIYRTQSSRLGDVLDFFTN